MQDMKHLLEEFSQKSQTWYKDELYQVRDNGAVFRYQRQNKRKRKLDEIWTFGNPCPSSGYMTLSSERVHRIVATAFHGIPKYQGMVVDHIDTNRQNNRSDNLRWVTKLENILLNPITCKKIIGLFGSVEEFLADPQKLRQKQGFLPKNFAWMRTLTKEEAEYSLTRLNNWAKSDEALSGGTLGEWIFTKKSVSINPKNDTFSLPTSYLRERSKPRIQMAHSKSWSIPIRNFMGLPENLVISKTPGALQRNWQVPAEFPSIPNENSEESIAGYFKKLKVGAPFAVTPYSTTIVQKSNLSENEEVLYVLGEQNEVSSLKPWTLAKVTFEGGHFVHESIKSFFTYEGAEKQMAKASGQIWVGEDTIDDYC